MTFNCVEIPEHVMLEPSVDLHAHLRNSLADGDGRMELCLTQCGIHHNQVVVHIGNGKPGILDQASADQELGKVEAILKRTYTYDRQQYPLHIFAGPLLTDRTTPEMIRETRLRKPRSVLFWKAFLSGVSNDSGNSVTDFGTLREVLKALYDPSIDAPPLPLHVHAERKRDRDGNILEMADREWYAVSHDLEELLVEHPNITLVLKHVSDYRTIERVKSWRRFGHKVFIEICPHYFFNCHTDLFEGPGGGTAFNAHLLCWPIYKSKQSQGALRELVLTGEDWVMMGLDWACHNDDPSLAASVKINNKGIVVGGVAILPPVAKSMLINLFLQEGGSIAALNKYISSNARRVHGLPAVNATDRYDYMAWEVPRILQGSGSNGKTITIRPYMGGERMNWAMYRQSML